MPSELREALTAAGAAALIPTIVDPQLLEYQRRYSPLVRSIPSMKWDSDTYYFNTRTVNPNGGFVTDGGARPLTQSTYVQNSFQMKHLQVVGAVTGYSQEVTKQLIGDLRAREIEGSIKGLYWDIEAAIVWGNAAATAAGAYPQFDGLDTQVNQFSGTSQNAIDVNGSISLQVLDQLADMVETNAAMSVFDSTWQFVMSPSADSKIAQILVANQRYVDRVEIAPGLLVPTYRNIPIVKSSFLSSRSYAMGAVTTATATSGGSLASATYYYRVSAVIARQGETAACAEVSQATTGSTSTVTLSFSTPTGQDGLQPVLYKVYRSTGTGTETLLGVVDATVGLDGNGNAVATTSIVDDGVKLVPKNGSTAPGTTPAAYVGTNANRKPLAANQESIFLMSRDEENIVRPYVRELTPLDVYPTTAQPDALPYAITADTTLAVRAPKFLGGAFRVTASV